ncbi:MAG TPA: RNA-guided endonuclease IscB [Ktedonobacteraceae bacterium]|nr:RNA-guided endonuclease IscB [Ktedonobacteraceae bacterium]
MSNVFVVDTNKQPLDMVYPGQARLLLSHGKAAVYRRYPFTLILKVAIDDPLVAELRIKIDPGSRTTGIAILNDVTGQVVFAAELTHRGQAIKKSLDGRRSVRRSRRNRHTRYRKPRWKNRHTKKKGWISPCMISRITNVITWVQSSYGCAASPLSAWSWSSLKGLPQEETRSVEEDLGPSESTNELTATGICTGPSAFISSPWLKPGVATKGMGWKQKYTQ